MSFFSELISRYIKELEDLKVKLNIEAESRIRQRAQEALSKYTEQITNVQSQVTLERERILYEAVVEARRRTAELSEQIVEAVINDVYDYVDKNRSSDDYIKFLEKALERAKEYIGPDATIYASPKDKNAVTALMRKLGMRGEVRDGDMRGGLLAESLDGSIKMDLTIESLIASSREELKRIIYSKL
ncbi:MAG: V-type ATP synthase subunit E [Thermoproteus sp. AZ2]|jgi:V/A-type H+-transporting ATPase subunit E|uniref:V-type ATP synthase subunit E n=1 Tax=Thermoproteus sp. AZ2 TaxID=1609232 RepID=A0ACC6UZT8_9CREN|nr:MAG: hypothetical protein TU35_01855 [Thermoproteus sp. AZ2]